MADFCHSRRDYGDSFLCFSTGLSERFVPSNIGVIGLGFAHHATGHRWRTRRSIEFYGCPVYFIGTSEYGEKEHRNENPCTLGRTGGCAMGHRMYLVVHFRNFSLVFFAIQLDCFARNGSHWIGIGGMASVAFWLSVRLERPMGSALE